MRARGKETMRVREKWRCVRVRVRVHESSEREKNRTVKGGSETRRQRTCRIQGAGEGLQQEQRRAIEMLSVLGGGCGGGGRRNNVFVSGGLLQQEKGKGGNRVAACL